MNSATNFNDRFQNSRDDHAHAPWSEVVAQRRRAVARTDSDSTFPASAPPPTPPPPDSLLAKKFSSCSCHRSRAGAEEPDAQHVEAKLYNAELEEAMSDERVEATRERLRRAAHLLDAQELFAQSLDLKARALARLTRVTGNFACNELLTSNALNTILDEIRWDVTGLSERLAEVADAAGAAVEAPDRLYQLMDDFRDKKKDFQAASSTLNQYLRTSKRVNASQRRQFEAQYDSIRGTFHQSRKLVEKELYRLIEARHAVVERCFTKLAPLQERMLEQDKQFLALSKEVSKCLQEPKKQGRECSQNRNKEIRGTKI